MKVINKTLIITLTLCLISKGAFCSPLLDKKHQNNLSPTAILQGLNKVTGKTSELEIEVGKEMNFGKLIIKVKKCWKSPADQRPENKILLEIEKASSNQNLLAEDIKIETDQKINKLGKTIFYGWMFSSSPSISSLEHPIYDITAIECRNN